MDGEGVGAEQPPPLLALAEAEEADDDQRVVEIADSILSSMPTSRGVLLSKAAACLGLDDKALFEETLDYALLVSEEPKTFLISRSVGLTAFKDFEEGLISAEDALAIDPHDSDCWMALAEACIGGQEGERALEAAEAAIAIDEEAGIRSVHHLSALSRAAVLARDFEKALDAADAVLREDEQNGRAYATRASALIQLDRADEAVESAERAYRLEPHETWALRARALSLAALEAHEEGEKAFREWLDAEPSAPEAWIGLGLLYATRSEWEKALSALRQALDLGSRYPEAKTWLGVALLEVGESAEALTLFRELTASESADDEVWLGRASAERALGFTEEAVESAQKALEASDFQSAGAWLELGGCYSAAGRHQSAWRAFGTAAELDRSSVEAAVGVAVESIFCNNETRALKELQEAEARLGPQALLEFNRGVALYKLGREASAFEAWSRARQLDPELGAADVLVAGMQFSKGAGSWIDYWFGPGAGTWEKVGGVLLLLSLAFLLSLPVLEEDLISGLNTGNPSLEAFIPAFIVALLLVLPAIRGLAVGSVSLDVSPMGAANPGPVIDPLQVLPVFTPDELDVSRLTKR